MGRGSKKVCFVSVFSSLLFSSLLFSSLLFSSLLFAILLPISSSTIFQTSIYRGVGKKRQKWLAKFIERTIMCHTELEAALMFDGWVREQTEPNKGIKVPILIFVYNVYKLFFLVFECMFFSCCRI